MANLMADIGRSSVSLAFLLSFLPAIAQTQTEPPTQDQMPTQTESLLIGPGDVLHIQYYDTPELEQHLRVDDAGKAPLLFLGRVALAGKTPDQAASTISALAVSGNLMRHPQVVVTVEQYATQEVSVAGEVSKPGKYAIATPRSVLDVLSMAGGLNSLADRHIVIRHANAAVLPTSYFVSNDPTQALSDDVKVSPGDTILVARVGFVYLLGDVGRPGGYPMSTNDSQVTLLQTLALAGSINKTAQTSKAKLVRKTPQGYVEVPLNLSAMQKGHAPDIALQANDVLYIPFSYARNFVLSGTSVAASVASAVLYHF